jgi:DNA processing protein
MAMGEGTISEIVLSLLLSTGLSRKRIVGALRGLEAPGAGKPEAGLFPYASPGSDGGLLMDSDRIAEARELLNGLGGQGVGVTCLPDPDYPPLLKEIHDPPPLLFWKGRPLAAAAPAVAVVGSRKATLGGMRFAAHLAGELALAGFVVVSGLARGIDTAAHKGALEAGGETVAVLGCGIDVVYPPENEVLTRDITDSGALVTELLPGARPLRANFPQRNRIISGLSLGTIVVEAGERSGALITAACAVEQNRSVFAVPGTPGYYGSKGTNSLLRQGAKLVESIEDVLEEIAPQVPRGEARVVGGLCQEMPGPEEERVLDLLSGVPVHVDEICRNLGLAPPEVVHVLFSLETRGLVKAMPGKFYVRQGTV